MNKTLGFSAAESREEKARRIRRKHFIRREILRSRLPKL
jgi:hypothetical protein